LWPGDRDVTEDVLKRIMDSIRDGFTYRAREEEGTQSPGQTLITRSGTCRDYAWLMIETLRRLGLACRFARATSTMPPWMAVALA
jgi:transglutaminase-like putative cysteine protease